MDQAASAELPMLIELPSEFVSGTDAVRATC